MCKTVINAWKLAKHYHIEIDMENPFCKPKNTKLETATSGNEGIMGFLHLYLLINYKFFYNVIENLFKNIIE